ncbi:hypothetical protein [Pollutibacter soli]|uniref:Trm112 family protein n=1 Tax=Pollutibacter soli TaxID=3034157 RepID=UPI0030139791
MQEEILSFLRCSVTGLPLRLQVIEEVERTYQQGRITEIKTGILSVGNGWFYPVIDGIPRMLPEAVYDYAGFLRTHIPDFDQQVETLEERYNQIASGNRQKNSRTKASFAMEWKFFHPEKKDKLWHFDQASLGSLFLLETGFAGSRYRRKAGI